MSINALANAAAARRPDTVPLGKVPKGLDGIARAAAVPPATVEAPVPCAATPAQQPSAVDTAFN